MILHSSASVALLAAWALGSDEMGARRTHPVTLFNWVTISASSATEDA